MINISHCDVMHMICVHTVIHYTHKQDERKKKKTQWLTSLTLHSLCAAMGNEKANSYWEAELPRNYDRVGIENFIRAKYGFF